MWRQKYELVSLKTKKEKQIYVYITWYYPQNSACMHFDDIFWHIMDNNWIIFPLRHFGWRGAISHITCARENYFTVTLLVEGKDNICAKHECTFIHKAYWYNAFDVLRACVRFDPFHIDDCVRFGAKNDGKQNPLTNPNSDINTTGNIVMAHKTPPRQIYCIEVLWLHLIFLSLSLSLCMSRKNYPNDEK